MWGWGSVGRPPPCLGFLGSLFPMWDGCPLLARLLGLCLQGCHPRVTPVPPNAPQFSCSSVALARGQGWGLEGSV